MDKRILVTGGTGTLGRLVVARLREAGRDVRVFSRHGAAAEADAAVESVTGDLASGAGLEAAVEGSEVIVHCAGARVGDDEHDTEPGPRSIASRGASSRLHLRRRRRPDSGPEPD